MWFQAYTTKEERRKQGRALYVAIASVVTYQLGMLMNFCVRFLKIEKLLFVLTNNASLGFESDSSYVKPSSATNTNYRLELES